MAVAGAPSLLCGISFRDDMELGLLFQANGINQNLKFFYDLLELMGHQPILTVQTSKPNQMLRLGARWYRAMTLDQLVASGQPCHIMFEAGTIVGMEDRTRLREQLGSKIVGVRFGHTMFQDMVQLCYMDTLPGGLHIAGQDMIWTSPHFEKTTSYLETLYAAEVRTCPYIWEPDFVDGRFGPGDYKERPDIYVMEPNMSILRNALVPMAIIQRVYDTDPNLFHEANIQNGMKFFENKYFLANIVANMECFEAQTKKGFFNPRRSFNEVFRTRDVLVGHQHECALNYLYLEALYRGVPLVHNAPPLREAGYYYPGNDVLAGAEKCMEAIRDKNVKGQRRKANALLRQFSIHNKAVQAAYGELIEEVMDL